MLALRPLAAAFALLLTRAACSPHEEAPSTTHSPPDLEPGDASFGLGLVLDDGATATDEPPEGTPPALAVPTNVSLDDAAAVDVASETATVASMGPPFDSAPGGACPPPLSPGDLVIDELMIESVAGAGDYGEWLEVRSTRDCALNIRGLHGDAPAAAKVRTFDIVDDAWLPPQGTFVVADSINPALNHDLPGMVVAWGGRPGDVLRNKGGTVTLRDNGAILDSLTFPSMAWMIGASLSFPSDCAESRRADWTAWQFSTASWFPGYEGTPNAPNIDVLCP